MRSILVPVGSETDMPLFETALAAAQPNPVGINVGWPVLAAGAAGAPNL